jgi:hypothetical protein
MNKKVKQGFPLTKQLDAQRYQDSQRQVQDVECGDDLKSP